MSEEQIRAIEAINVYFLSGNDIPVERATIKREEWELVKAALSAKSVPERILTNTNREFTMDNRQFSYEGNGYIQDNNFDFDAGLMVSGDFVDEDKDKYCQMIVGVLNALHPSLQCHRENRGE